MNYGHAPDLNSRLLLTLKGTCKSSFDFYSAGLFYQKLPFKSRADENWVVTVQAMDALHGMDRYQKEVVSEYTKEWYKGSVSLQNENWMVTV